MKLKTLIIIRNILFLIICLEALGFNFMLFAEFCF